MEEDITFNVKCNGKIVGSYSLIDEAVIEARMKSMTEGERFQVFTSDGELLYSMLYGIEEKIRRSIKSGPPQLPSPGIIGKIVDLFKESRTKGEPNYIDYIKEHWNDDEK